MKTASKRPLFLALVLTAIVLSAPLIATGDGLRKTPHSAEPTPASQFVLTSRSCPGVALRAAKFARMLADPDFQRAHPKLVEAHSGLLENLGIALVKNPAETDSYAVEMLKKSI